MHITSVFNGKSQKKKTTNRGTEDMIFPGVSKKQHVEFPGALVFDLGISKGYNTILWNFQGWSFILSEIFRGKVKIETF